MAYHPKQKLTGRSRRKVRVRKRVEGSSERPRLSVFRSAKHIYAQVINDEKGITLASASTQSTALKGELDGKTKKECARLVGKLLADICKEKQIDKAVFDRNGYLYHGRVKEVAEGARENGLNF